MTKEDILQEIMRCTYGTDLEKKRLEAYLLGEKEKNEVNIKILQFYLIGINLREFFKEGNEKLPEVAEVLIRLISLLSEKAPDRLAQAFNHTQERYRLYQMAKVSKKFIMQDLSGYMEQLLQRSYYNNYNSIAYTEKVIEETMQSICTYYPEIAEELEKNAMGYTGWQQISAFFLLAQQARKRLGEKLSLLPNQPYFKKDDTVMVLERLLFTWLHKLTEKETLKRLAAQYASDNTADYMKELVPIKGQETVIKHPVIFLLLGDKCSGLSPLIYEAMRLFFLVISPNILYYHWFRQDSTLWEYCKRFSLPLEMQLRYILCRLIDTYQREESITLTARVEEILAEQPKVCQECMNTFFAEQSADAIPLLALCLKHQAVSGKEAKEKLEAAEKMLIDTIAALQAEKDVFQFEEANMQDFLFLKQENAPVDAVHPTASSRYQYFLSKQYLMDCVFLMDYSIVARNMIKIIYHTECLSNCYYINIFALYDAFALPKAKPIYDRLYEEYRFSLETLCLFYLTAGRYYGAEIEKQQLDFLNFLKQHKQEAEQGVLAFSFDNELLLQYLKLLYDKDRGFDYCYLANALQKKTKTIANYVENRLKGQEEAVRETVEELTHAKSKITSDAAMRLLRVWDNDKIETALKQMTSVEQLEEYVQKQYSKNNEKNVPFAKEIDYHTVRMRDQDTLLPEVLTKYFVSEYILIKELYSIKICKKIQAFANPYDLRALLSQIYELWLSEGAGAKYRNILLPYSLTAGEGQITELKKQIDTWADNSKPALAAFAVQALSMNGSQMALLMVDTMAKKHKSKKVKAAAAEALNLAAEELGISREELDDSIVPDLDFDRYGKRSFSYGKRKFIATLDEKLEISLSNEEGEKIKSLPKASAKYEDNEDLVKSCKEDYKAIKKQLKLILDTQKFRIQKAVFTGRKWSGEKWWKMFIENRIMQCFARGLVWEVLDQNGALEETFRFLEDGTFTTAEEEEYTFDQKKTITPLHPVDTDAEKLALWREQLADYEINQPVEQLEIPGYSFSEEEKEKQEITAFRGKKVYAATFKSVAVRFGFSGLFDEYGEYCGCFYDDEVSRLTVKIHTSSFYAGDYNAITELKTITFHQEETGQAAALLQAPARLMSYAAFVASRITAKLAANKED